MKVLVENVGVMEMELVFSFSFIKSLLLLTALLSEFTTLVSALDCGLLPQTTSLPPLSQNTTKSK